MEVLIKKLLKLPLRLAALPLIAINNNSDNDNPDSTEFAGILNINQLEDMREEVRRLEVVKREFIRENKQAKPGRSTR